MGINIPNAVPFAVTYLIEQPDFTDVLRGQGMRRRNCAASEVIQRLNQIVGRLSPRGLCVVVVDQ